MKIVVIAEATKHTKKVIKIPNNIVQILKPEKVVGIVQ
jgi:hypothetical protein